jgi:hypothetical protein
MEIIFELILQIAFEGLAELGWRSGEEVFARRRVRNPWLAGFGTLMFGVIAGLLSLLVFREHFIKDSALRVLSLIFTPLLAGLVMWAIGRWRMRRQLDSIRLESFAHGYLFALGMGLIRYVLCK